MMKNLDVGDTNRPCFLIEKSQEYEMEPAATTKI